MQHVYLEHSTTSSKKGESGHTPGNVQYFHHLFSYTNWNGANRSVTRAAQLTQHLRADRQVPQDPDADMRGTMTPVFIIAEAGINHNGDVDLARQMIASAKACGADCIKFQTFKAHEFISDPNQPYTYRSQGKNVTESMLEMFRRCEFSPEAWLTIIQYCRDHEILFCSTAQNPGDLDFLLTITQLPFVKVGSDDLTNLELMRHYGAKQLPMIISAGMAFAFEIEDAVQAIRSVGNQQITVLHCVSSYPAPPKDVNLKKIPTIRDAFGVNVGFSDHTIGSAAAIGAVIMGAQVIEKHFTMDHGLPGPDHWFSITPSGLKSYIDDIHSAQDALGSAQLIPTENEISMRIAARRKVVAKQDLEAGIILNSTHITYKRNSQPEAIDPKQLPFLTGRKLRHAKSKDDPIMLQDLM